MVNSDNVRLVTGMYDAFKRGDVPAILGAFAPDIRWNEAEGYPYADGNPYVGGQAILQGVFARLGAEWDDFRVVPHEILATDGGALSLGRYSGTCKATGKAVDAQFAHLWRIADGKVQGFQQFTDTAQFVASMR